MVSDLACGPQISAHLCLLSADDPAALLREVRNVERLAERSTATDLSKLVKSLGTPGQREYRLAVLAESCPDLLQKLQSARQVFESGKHVFRMRTGVFCGFGPVSGKVAFLFPGQGSQYPGMLQQLGMRVPAVRRWFDALDAAYQRAGEPAPSERLSGAGPSGETALLDMEAGAQLGLVGSLAMHELLLRLGVVPDSVLGHSNGEHAALIASGLIRFDALADLCDELCAVGKAAKHLKKPETPERMLAVSRPDHAVLGELLGRFAGQLFLAIDNCPTQILLGGSLDAIESAAGSLRRAGSICAALPFERAHHTPLFSDWAALLRNSYDGVAPGPAKVPVYSAATVSRFPSGGPEVWDLMASQWCRTVRFRETVQLLYTEGVRVFLELGPDAKLSAIVTDTLRGRSHLAVSASSRGRDEVLQLLHLCGELYAVGIPLRSDLLSSLFSGEELPEPVPARDNTLRAAVIHEHRSTVAMVSSADNRIRQRFRALSATTAVAPDLPTREEQPGRWPLTGRVEWHGSDSLVCVREFNSSVDQFLLDHSMGSASGPGRVPVLAFTLTTAIVAEAATRFSGAPISSISQVRAHRWLVLDRGKMMLRIKASRLSRNDDAVRVHIWEVDEGGEFLAFEAVAHLQASRSSADPSVQPIQGTAAGRWTPKRFYSEYAFHGPSYQGLRKVLGIRGNRMTAELTVTALPGVQREDWQLDPALLDCAGQLAALWLLEDGEGRPGLFPFALKELRILAPPPPVGTKVLCRGTVERSVFGTTRASFDFMFPDGSIFWQVKDLEQRIVTFPERMADCMFGKDPDALIASSLPVGDGMFLAWLAPERAHFLNQNQGIWARLLAGTVLSAQERDCWSAMERSARPAWLKGQLVARDAVRLWARAHELTFSADQLVVQQQDNGSYQIKIPGCPVRVPQLFVAVETACAAALASYEHREPRCLEVVASSARRSDVPDSFWQTEADGFRLIFRAAVPAFEKEQLCQR